MLDLLAEYPDGGVFDFEIKPSSAGMAKDGRHSAGLRDELGDRLLGSPVQDQHNLDTGP